MAEAGLYVRDLAVSFGAARVLEEISFHVRPGQITGLVGPNGAGKTTALRAISGLVPRKAGIVELDGALLPADPVEAARAGVAHVPEGRGLIPSLTVSQNLALGLIGLGRKYRHQDTEYVIKIFPAISRLLDRRAGLLSGGEQQMVAIARGIIVSPKILMVDEMSLGLAPKIVQDLLEALMGVIENSSIGVLLVDQNVRALSKACGEIYVLQNGRSNLAEKGDEKLIQAVYFGADTSLP